MALKHFGLIDIMEAYSMMGLVACDFDETYKHHTDKMNAWIEHHQQFQNKNKIAKYEDGDLLIELNDVTYTFIIDTPRKDVIGALAILINITHPQGIDSIEYMVKNVFSKFKIIK